MAHGIVRHPRDVAQPDKQQPLGPLERLNLTLPIHAQHHGMLGSVEVRPVDVAQVLNEGEVVGGLETALAIWLHAEQIELGLHVRLGDAGVLGHGAYASMRRLGWQGPQGGVDHLGDPFGQFVVETTQA